MRKAQWWQLVIIGAAAVVLLVQVGGWLYRQLSPAPVNTPTFERVRQLQRRSHSGQPLSDRDVDALLAVLKSADSIAVTRAVSALTYINDRRQIAKVLPAIKECLRHERPVVRGYALRAIERLGSSEDVKVVKPLLSDPDPYVREFAQRTVRILQKKQPEMGGSR